jgi:hypothetical protein
LKDIRLAKMRKNTGRAIDVTLGVDVEVRVVGIGSVVRDGKVAVICELSNESGALLVGQEIAVKFTGRR